MDALRLRLGARPLTPALAWLGLAALAAALVPLMMARIDLVLIAVPALVAAAWLMGHPFWGVLLVFAGWFLRMPAGYAVMAVLLVPLGLQIYRERQVRVLRAMQIRVLLALGALFLLSTAWNEFLGRVPWLPDTDDTRQALIVFAIRVAFLVFAFYFIDTPRRVTAWAWLFIALVAVAAGNALHDFSMTSGWRRAHAEFGLAGNANRMAHLCLFATSLAWFYRAHGPDPRLRACALPFLFLFPITVLYAGSRSGLLQLVMLGVLVIASQEGWSPAQRVRSIAVIGCVVLALAALAPTDLLTRKTSFDPHQAEKGQDSLKNRINTVIAAIDLIVHDPVMGVGIGNFRSMKRTYYGLPREEGTHNSYLWAMLAGGVGALALYLYLLFRTYRMLRYLERWGPRDLLWLARGLRVGLVLFIFFSTFADFWLTEMFPVAIGLPMVLSLAVARLGVLPARATARPAAAGRPAAALAPGAAR